MSNTVPRRAGTFADVARAALLATAPVGPLIAALLVLAAALQGELKEAWFSYLPAWMLLPGMVYLLAAWVLIALIWAVLGFTDVTRANPATYRELRNQLTEAEAAQHRLGPAGAGAAGSYLRDVRAALECDAWSRASWVLGTGYVSLWQLLHRAQEALIALEPIGGVVARAQYDLMRLANSGVSNREVLRERLSQTIDLLMPLAADSADVDARVSLLATMREARAQLAPGPTTDRAQLQTSLAQLHTIQHAVATAPIASDHRLSLLVELRTAIRDLSGALAASALLEAPEAASGGTQRNGASSPQQTLAAAAATVAVVGGVATSSTSSESAESTPESTPAAVTPPGTPEVLPQTYQIRNWRELSDQLNRLCDYLGQVPSGSPRQDLSVVETVVARMRDQSTLRPPEFVAEARLVVSTIRETLNEYRDDSRAGLVRARNQLAWTCVVTALCAYAVVWLAVASSVPFQALQVGVAYFLVGALVGLFSRLNGELGADTATDDYGLSAMRLIAAPQLAGVAAVAGVALLALTGMTAGDALGGQSLQKAFTLPFQPANMLAAAAFGLAPGLLIDRLKQQTETLKGNLTTTMPQGTTSVKGEPT